MKKLTRKIKWALLLAGVGVLAEVVLVFVVPRGNRGPLEVPLGVEHALALSYSGPELTVKPYSYGVAVSLRIAGIKEHDGRRTYDIRYMLNRGGTYNITDYLTTVEGVDPAGMPAFTVRGLESLSEGVDKRIQELSKVNIEIWHYYYETMTLVVALWVLWLGLIVFWPREREAVEENAGPFVDPFPARLRGYLDLVAQGKLVEADKARMEMMLIDHWRTELPITGLRMHATVRRIGDDPRFEAAYHAMVDWLHNPATSVTNAQLVEHLSPYTRVDQQGGAS
ncbi:MAG: hypothetical protein GC164_15475 [Phycisphaera sp.]|nr:hypothetical protein [Phycisphaera sp.]